MKRALASVAVFFMAAPADAAARTAHSTSYCLNGTMADGTHTRSRSVAMNSLPLGSKVYVVDGNTRTRRREKGPLGLRIWIVRDRIGWGSEMDFWQPSCDGCMQWARKTVRFKVLRYGR